MAQTFENIPDEFVPWIHAQPVFFVATAPANPGTHVNVSPRGLDSFRVIGRNRVAWLDLTGSGVETIAHLRADGRITLMFCAFDGPPRIVRLYGHGTVHEPGDEVHEELSPHLPDLPGARAIVDVAVERVSSSCGYGVPLMDFVGAREQLVESARRKGEAKMASYRARKNTASIDGLPGLEPTSTPDVGGNARSEGQRG
ncbi:MAG: pyridoxamine 5'-phosphate oxidase family protein [Rubrobacteraceae bacterium]|nr:pyridoxamine 5'-phosphate oxidase family protein [Rubrobacteraceae bacterium]